MIARTPDSAPIAISSSREHVRRDPRLAAMGWSAGRDPAPTCTHAECFEERGAIIPPPLP